MVDVTLDSWYSPAKVQELLRMIGIQRPLETIVKRAKRISGIKLHIAVSSDANAVQMKLQEIAERRNRCAHGIDPIGAGIAIGDIEDQREFIYSIMIVIQELFEERIGKIKGPIPSGVKE